MAQHQSAQGEEYERPARMVVRLLLFDRFQNQVQPFELHSIIDGSALPVDLDVLSVVVTLPGGSFVFHHGAVQHAAVEPLPPHHL